MERVTDGLAVRLNSNPSRRRPRTTTLVLPSPLAAGNYYVQLIVTEARDDAPERVRSATVMDGIASRRAVTFGRS